MATLNGFGTMFYGWKHPASECSTATKWLTAFYIPIIPLGRYKLDVLTDFARERTKVQATPVGLVASQENRFGVSEQTSLSWPEVLLTYLKAFVVLPLLMLGPLLIIWLLSKMPWFPHYQSEADAPAWFNIITMGLSASTLISVLYWPIWAIRKSRGMQSGGSASPSTASKSAL